MAVICGRHRRRIAVPRSALKVKHQQNARHRNSFSARAQTSLSVNSSLQRSIGQLFSCFLLIDGTEATAATLLNTEGYSVLTSCKCEINNSGMSE